MRLLLTLLALIGIPAVCHADQPFHFSMTDGSEFKGQLLSADSERLVVESSLFDEPLLVRLSSLLRAERDASARLAPAEEAFAFELRDQSRFVGRPIGFDAGRLRVSTVSLGEVEIEIGQLRRVTRATELEERICSLPQSAHLWNGKDWSFQEGQFVVSDAPRREAESAFRATVADFNLPRRFRLKLRLACSGEPSFQLMLGDRSSDGGGQGRGRRGSSRSLSPEEEKLTQIEWYGDGVSLTRRTSSLADMALFGSDSSTLTLDVYFDQTRGLVAAYRNGVLVGKVDLPDEGSEFHREMTLASRGDVVAVTAFELLRWSGDLPVSRLAVAPFIETTDGELRATAELGADTDWGTLRRIEWPGEKQRYPMECVEILCRDGSRLAGKFLSESPNDGVSFQSLGGSEFTFESSNVARLIALGRAPVIEEQAVLRTRDERLVGQPAAGKDGALAWQARFATEPMRLRANATATIDWNRSVQPAETAIVLNDGQRLTGRSVGVESGKVSFQPDVSERVQVPLGRVARLELRQTRSFNTSELPAALTLPRRQASDPPTHLLFSTTGDTVRGRLLSMDAKEDSYGSSRPNSTFTGRSSGAHCEFVDRGDERFFRPNRPCRSIPRVDHDVR